VLSAPAFLGERPALRERSAFALVGGVFLLSIRR
jgi:hypothetical protein